MVYVPKYCENPHKEARIKFNHTNEVRHALAKHDLRARLEGIYFEELNPDD